MGLHFGYNVMDSIMDFPNRHPSNISEVTPQFPNPSYKKDVLPSRKSEKKRVHTFFFQSDDIPSFFMT